MVKICSRGGKKKPSLIIEEVTDTSVTFSVKNNDPFLNLTITKISLIHKTEVDITKVVLVSSEGNSFMSKTPRENLGTYVMDISTHETKLTKPYDIINIAKGATGSYFFNFKVDTTNSKVFFSTTKLSEMLKTNWLISKLVIKYVGKNRLYVLSADLKTGVESKESVSLDL